MKLVRCYVASFGNIKDFTFDFVDGLNVVKRDNGWGKTTLTMFIKSMFYGLKGSAKHSVSDNERKKYKPWGSLGKFGGYLDFDWDGTLYRIERFFGNKPSDDEIRLIDLATGKSFRKTENLGERIFGIDEDGFFSTTYFSEEDFVITGNTSLTAKYNSVLGVQSNDSFDNALTKIETAAKKYKMRAGKGLIEDKHNEIKEISDDIARANLSLDVLRTLKNDVSILETNILTVQSEINVLTEKITQSSKSQAVAEKKKIFEAAKHEREMLILELKEIEAYFDGIIPDEALLATLGDCYKQLNAVQKNISLLKEDIAKAESVATANSGGINRRSILITALLSGVVVVFGFICMFLISSVPGILCISLGILGTAFSLIVLFKVIKKEKCFTPKDDVFKKKKEDLAVFINIENEYQATINEFTNKYKAGDGDFISTLFTVREKLVKRDGLLKELDKQEKTISYYDSDKDLVESGNNDAVDIDELKGQLIQKQAFLQDLNRKCAEKKSAQSRIDDAVSQLPDLENKRAQLREEETEYIRKYDILVKTSEFLKTADVNLKTRYRQPLENSFIKYVSLLSAGKFPDAHIDVDFNVTVSETGVAKEQEYYSKGSRALFEACKRFALIDVLFTKEKPFMILDDPFVNFDEEKIGYALKLIGNLSETYQVIYFVCHDSRKSDGKNFAI